MNNLEKGGQASHDWDLDTKEFSAKWSWLSKEMAPLIGWMLLVIEGSFNWSSVKHVQSWWTGRWSCSTRKLTSMGRRRKMVVLFLRTWSGGGRVSPRAWLRPRSCRPARLLVRTLFWRGVRLVSFNRAGPYWQGSGTASLPLAPIIKCQVVRHTF
jgi:hypothetical protein